MAIETIYAVIDYIDEAAKSTVERGEMWEKVTTYYLRSDPQQRQVMGEVWRWSDAPTNDGQDTGIDIVSEYTVDFSEEPRYWAVQCKNYSQTHKYDLKDVSTFFSKAQADKRYAGFALSLTSDHVSKNLEELCEQTGTTIITPSVMAASNIDWSGVFSSSAANARETYDLREHQRDAVQQINAVFQLHDRCKAIMACGSGKTLMSLRLAEDRCAGGDVLFAAPSIALVAQAMREWTNQSRTELRTLVVCSDAKASKANDSDMILDSVADLAYPATTDPATLVSRYREIRRQSPDAMVAVFCTYQSMQVVQDAQEAGMPEFDLAICDEAHRTTGIKDETMSDDDVSAFQIIHDQKRIHARKRVYMTATPRIYGDQAKRKAREDDFTLASMDDESIYGPVAYELSFAAAVDRGLLCDYRVVVLSISEDAIPAYAQGMMSDGSELQMSDIAKIIGCYKGLATHGAMAQRKLSAMSEAIADSTPDFFLIDEVRGDVDTTLEEGGAPEGVEPLHRAVGFCARIADSKRMDEFFAQVVEGYRARTGDGIDLACKLDHVDGSMDSKLRAEKLRWLSSGEDVNECRILTNARCLAEGVDVPSLDAVIFFAPRKSEVDIVQAVGRVMRAFTNPKTGERKELGYIILPVFIPANMTPEESLNNSQTFDVVWKVLQALRSHDERIDAYVNSLNFRRATKGSGAGAGGKNVVGKPPVEGQEPEQDAQLRIDFGSELPRAIYAKMVSKCGTKIYWDTWADDVARIAERHVQQVADALETDPVARKSFDGFLQGLRDSLNPGIKESEAIEMVAQHMITLPVFEALFGDFEFAHSNPVSIAIEEFVESLEGHGVGDMDAGDRRSLDDLYASVRRRAKVVRTDYGRQELIRDLYENFFSKAFKATSEKLGIVYTPSQIIEYILHATDRVLWREFGHKLADEGVHILDPFAGTGSFMARLIEDPDLMPASKLRHKYLHELHSNEILLLAYYIMVVNIEYAYHSRMGGGYEAFPGAVLTDTFQMSEENDQSDLGLFIDNTERVFDQERLDIQVIVGNPPYSMGQKNANDDNANEKYETLDKSIEDTYVKQSLATRQSALYDSYIRAFRWASNRIGNSGIICYVSNAGWLKSAAGDGVRRCFVDEFNSIYVLDLRGNQRTQGEESRKEGGKVFGSGSRAPIAITMLVKNPDSKEHGVIRYVDVGDYKTREEKLEYALEAARSEPEWVFLEPDAHGDWLNQRDDSFYHYAPMGLLDGKKKTKKGMFNFWSLGVVTARDSWVWNYSLADAKSNVERLVENTNAAIRSSFGDVENLEFDSTRYSWSRAMQGCVKRQQLLDFDIRNIVKGAYRPFCNQWLYFGSPINEVTYQIPALFPLMAPGVSAQNMIIDYGERGPFIANLLPDYELDHHGQCFPLYWYERLENQPSTLFDERPQGEIVEDSWGNRYVRHDAVTDETLAVFKAAYPQHPFARQEISQKTGRKLSKVLDENREITKEDIFYYVYGILHSPIYREKYAANLAKELPRIPLAREFAHFSMAGRSLADLHLNYETAPIWPNLDMGILPGADPGPVQKLAWCKKVDPESGKKVIDYTRLAYSKDVVVSGIPERAHDYKVNGRSPLEWMVDRYQVKVDKASGIVNDPNEYSDDPRYILDLIGRLVTVSMETLDIIDGLPGIEEVEHPANWPAAWTTI